MGVSERLRGFQQEVKVIAHEKTSVNPPAGALAGLAEAGEENEVILPRLEDSLSPVATGHDVVNGTGILEPQRPCHDRSRPSRGG